MGKTSDRLYIYPPLLLPFPSLRVAGGTNDRERRKHRCSIQDGAYNSQTRGLRTELQTARGSFEAARGSIMERKNIRLFHDLLCHWMSCQRQPESSHCGACFCTYIRQKLSFGYTLFKAVCHVTSCVSYVVTNVVEGLLLSGSHECSQCGHISAC